jgi:hypothetical protein
MSAVWGGGATAAAPTPRRLPGAAGPRSAESERWGAPAQRLQAACLRGARARGRPKAHLRCIRSLHCGRGAIQQLLGGTSVGAGHRARRSAGSSSSRRAVRSRRSAAASSSTGPTPSSLARARPRVHLARLIIRALPCFCILHPLPLSVASCRCTPHDAGHPSSPAPALGRAPAR